MLSISKGQQLLFPNDSSFIIYLFFHQIAEINLHARVIKMNKKKSYQNSRICYNSKQF